jgi:hypothetical protein
MFGSPLLFFVYRGNSYHCHFEFVAAIRVESTQKKLHNIFNTRATVVENSSENATYVGL